jgi:hypothetical protein
MHGDELVMGVGAGHGVGVGVGVHRCRNGNNQSWARTGGTGGRVNLLIINYGRGRTRTGSIISTRGSDLIGSALDWFLGTGCEDWWWWWIRRLKPNPSLSFVLYTKCTVREEKIRKKKMTVTRAARYTPAPHSPTMAAANTTSRAHCIRTGPAKYSPSV